MIPIPRKACGMSAEGFGARSSSVGLIAEGLEGLVTENIGRVDRGRMAEG